MMPSSLSETASPPESQNGPAAPGKKSKSSRFGMPSLVPTSYVVKLQSTMHRLNGMFTPSDAVEFSTAKTATSLFPPTKPDVDGEDCLHDCDSCTISLPRKWSIDESDKLYGHVKGWDYHVIVATGKSDWVRDVIDEKGSLMEGLGVHGLEIQPAASEAQTEHGAKRRRIMLSASDMPTGDIGGDDVDEHGNNTYSDNGRTNVILLPSWKLVEGVSKNEVGWLVDDVLANGPRNLDRIGRTKSVTATGVENQDLPNVQNLNISAPGAVDNVSATATAAAAESTHVTTTIPPSIPQGVKLNTLHHKALILMCSHKTRDARCGQSAPLLRREFERHLRPLGLYRDLHDERPGGVGIYFINHVGGHKYSANVMIYRRQGSTEVTGGSDQNGGSAVINNIDTKTDTSTISEHQQPQHDEAIQGIWLARVRPEDCENIVRYTVLQGKVVKPMRQLRGGFDRSSGLASW